MRCEQGVFADLYLIGELNDRERLAFDEHLLSCDECQTAIHESRMLDDLLAQGNARVQIDPNWLDSALEELERAKKHSLSQHAARGRRHRLVTGSCLALAASMAVVAMVIFVKRPIPNTSLRSAIVANPSQAYDQPSPIDEPAVVALEGYLAAKIPSADESIEVYWVLPTNSSF